jgi:hypothetical protein
VSLIFVEATTAPAIANQARLRGYVARDVNALHKLWQPVVKERLRPGDQIFVKQLREELITRPV